MKRLWVIGICVVFGGCGSGQEFSYSSYDGAPNVVTDLSGGAGVNTNVAKGSDAELERVVEEIYSERYLGSLLLSFKENLHLEIKENRLMGDKGAEATIQKVNKLLEGDPSLKLSGHFGGKGFEGNLKQIRNMTAQLEKLSGEDLADLSKYVELEAKEPKKAEKFLRGAWKSPMLKRVGANTKRIPQGIAAGGTDFIEMQGYLGAPVPGNYGLNIRAFWDRYENKGAGAAFDAGESGYNSGHEDLNIPFGVIGNAHGTAVMGIIAGVHGNAGISGIAPDATTFDEPYPWELQLFVRSRGGIINNSSGLNGARGRHCDLFQYGGLPLEAAPGHFDGFKALTAAGFTVVQGAGNECTDLDDPNNLLDDSPDWTRNGENSYVDDSGAIMVGAVNAGTLDITPWSNYGSRVDLFTWGTNVVTTSYPAGGIYEWRGNGYQNDRHQPNAYYTNQFAGTSATSAMVSGMATLLQSYAKSRMGEHKFLTSKRIRGLLVRSGIPANPNGGLNIGVMPNMVRAAELFDEFWDDLTQRYPILLEQGTLSGEPRRQLYQDEGVGMNCELYDINYERSDLQCPERAQCALESMDWQHFDPYRESFYGQYCSYSMLCRSLDVEHSDFDCIAGAIWPSGLRAAKTLDFDADRKSELINQTSETIQIDLSSVNGFGAWDLNVHFPNFNSQSVWPVNEDFDADGRTDIGMFDKKTGRLYIRYTDRALMRGEFGDWDRVIEYPFRDIPSRDIFQYVYVRPVFGDWNQDSYVDVAFALQGRVEIDYGGWKYNGLGEIDEPTPIQYLSPRDRAIAPDWGYLAITNSWGIRYQVPDHVVGAGTVCWYYRDRIEPLECFAEERVLWGNEVIPVESDGFVGYKSIDGMWNLDYPWFQWGGPSNVFGGLECHPFVGDFDGDGARDRAVQCPNEFRIVLSSDDSVVTYPLSYDPRKFSLPGKTFLGGLSYATTLRLINYQLNSSNGLPVIPVDMASPSICAIPWDRIPGDPQIPPECQ